MLQFEPEPPVFLIIVEGDSEESKNDFIQSLRKNPFLVEVKDGTASTSIDTCQLRFETNRGPVIFNIWKRKLGGLAHYPIQGHGAIVVYDETSHSNFTRAHAYRRTISRVFDGVPIVMCGTNGKSLDQKTQNRRRHVELVFRIFYCDIDTYAIAPLLHMARQIANDEGLQFTKVLGAVQITTSDPPNLLGTLMDKPNFLIEDDDDDL